MKWIIEIEVESDKVPERIIRDATEDAEYAVARISRDYDCALSITSTFKLKQTN